MITTWLSVFKGSSRRIPVPAGLHLDTKKLIFNQTLLSAEIVQVVGVVATPVEAAIRGYATEQDLAP